MKTKFEICEGCPITNKDDCLLVFGSKECAKILVNEEKIENKKVEAQEFIKIREYFEGHLDNPNARIIRFIPIELWGANHKTKKQARFKILIPPEICDENLKDFEKWFLTIVAIPKKDI